MIYTELQYSTKAPYMTGKPRFAACKMNFDEAEANQNVENVLVGECQCGTPPTCPPWCRQRPDTRQVLVRQILVRQQVSRQVRRLGTARTLRGGTPDTPPITVPPAPGKSLEAAFLAWVSYFVLGCLPILLVRNTGGKVQGANDMKNAIDNLNDRITAILKAHKKASPPPHQPLSKNHRPTPSFRTFL